MQPYLHTRPLTEHCGFIHHYNHTYTHIKLTHNDTQRDRKRKEESVREIRERETERQKL